MINCLQYQFLFIDFKMISKTIYSPNYIWIIIIAGLCCQIQFQIEWYHQDRLLMHSTLSNYATSIHLSSDPAQEFEVMLSTFYEFLLVVSVPNRRKASCCCFLEVIVLGLLAFKSTLVVTFRFFFLILPKKIALIRHFKLSQFSETTFSQDLNPEWT